MMESYAGTGRSVARTHRDRLGGTEGNEILTAARRVLTLLLMAEGITLLQMARLLSVHMSSGWC